MTGSAPITDTPASVNAQASEATQAATAAQEERTKEGSDSAPATQEERTRQDAHIAAETGRLEVNPVPDWARDADPIDLAPALEAICFALNRPLTLSEAAAILGRSTAAAAEAADVVAAELRRRGLMLQRHQEEIQLVTRPEVAWAVQRALNPERPGRLSRAALETLAIVAYRQPVTRGAIEAIRGVNCEAVLDSLERRELIAEVGRQDSPGQPRLFGTTLRFLQVVGLERIEQLPPLAEGAIPALSAASLGLKSDTENELGGDEPPASTSRTV